MNKHPAISAVIPVFNLEDYVENTLDSVLNQTVLPDEMIVVDDGSTDNTFAILQKIASNAPKGLIRVIRHEHSGPGATRNYGIQESKGDWIAFLDGDDRWLPDKIAKVISAIENNQDVGIVTHDMFQIDSITGKEEIIEMSKKFNPRISLFPQLYRRSFLMTSCMVVKKSSLAKAKGFDVHLASSQDYDLWLTIARFEKAFFIEDPLTRYTARRPGNISNNLLRRYLCLAKIRDRHASYLKEFVGRKRACRLYLTKTLIDHYFAIQSCFKYKGKVSDLVIILALLPVFLGGTAYKSLTRQ